MPSSTSPSQLTQDSDFAAELLLNRIMNGQLASETGKTVTAANRALASTFDQTAQSYGVIAENVANGMTIVEGTQNALTELVDQVKSLSELCSSSENDSQAQSLALGIKDNIDAILASVVQGTTVLGDQGRTLTIGEGGSETLDVGKAAINASGTAFNTLYTGLSSITPSSAQALCSDALDELYGAIAKQGAQYSILSNRYDLLNDLASTYHKASDDEAKQNTTSTDTLLSVVL